MTNNPINHHFVPKCYLNLFTDFQKKFWKKRVDNRKITETVPSKVCYLQNGYSFRDEQNIILNNLEDKYHVERHSFKYQESNYGKIINDVIRFSNTPIVVDKNRYALFIEMLVTVKRRNPSSKTSLINNFRESYKSEEAISKFIEFYSQVTGIKDVDPEMESHIKEYLANKSKNIDHLHDMYLSAFINKNEYTTIHEVSKDLNKLKQHILHPSIGLQFITSDNPGFTRAGGEIINLGGFGGDFEFYFPLSPDACLYLNSKIPELKQSVQKTIHHSIISKDHVQNINRATETICMNAVFALNKTVFKMF